MSTDMNLSHGQTMVNGVLLHYVEAGTGPLVLLLHGFPEFWYSWRFQIPALAASGYRVIAPDMRGYNLSEKPPGVLSYHIRHLVDDVAELLRTFGGEDGGYLVGHDWGGIVAWHAAARHLNLVRKLVILNAPHPNRFLDVLRASRRQLVRSNYVVFFQLPWLPEFVLTAARGALVARALRAGTRTRAHFTWEDAQAYREAICRPGAATAALNYYRNMGWRTVGRGMQERSTAISVPTLLLWGRHDPALELANADRDALLRWVPSLEVEHIDAGHFVHIDQPEIVSSRMISFFQNVSH